MEHEYEIIEQYLNKELTGTALSNFEKELSNNSSLQEKVKLYAQLKQAIGNVPKIEIKEKQLRQTLQPFGEEYFKNKSSIGAAPLRVSFVKKHFLKIAAVASFLIFSFIGANFWIKHNYNNQTIAHAHHEQTGIGSRSIDLQNLNLTTNNSKDKTYLLTQYILGENHFKQNEFEAAKVMYTNILANRDNPIYDKKEINFEAVMWNRLLTYLALENMDSVKEELISIQNGDFSQKYKEKGMELTEYLNSYWHKYAN